MIITQVVLIDHISLINNNNHINTNEALTPPIVIGCAAQITAESPEELVKNDPSVKFLLPITKLEVHSLSSPTINNHKPRRLFQRIKKRREAHFTIISLKTVVVILTLAFSAGPKIMHHVSYRRMITIITVLVRHVPRNYVIVPMAADR